MRPKLILTVVLLIVAPTGLLSLLAGWHLHEREALIDERIQAIAQSSVRAVARQVRQKLDDTLGDVHAALTDAMQAGGDAPRIGAVTARLRESRPLLTEVYVFMNPWGFIHPVIAGGEHGTAAVGEETGAAPERGPTDALAAALRSRIAAAAAWNEPIGVSAAHHAFCFVRLEERRGLYVGYRINPTELNRILRTALMDFSGGGIELGIEGQGDRGTEGQGDGGTERHPRMSDFGFPPLATRHSPLGTSPSASETGGDTEPDKDGVVVRSLFLGSSHPVDTNGPATDRSKSGERLPGGARLASMRLDPPLDHIAVSATAADVGAMRAAEKLRLNLLKWGVVLLVLSVLAGVGVALREVAAEVRLARSRSDFVVGVSHDLRTPVASMKMLAESLLAGHVRNPEREKQFLGTIVRECERLHQLVERVLFFVRYGQNALAFQRRPVDAVELVREAVHAFAARVGAELKAQGSGGPGNGERAETAGCLFSIEKGGPVIDAAQPRSPERQRGDEAAAGLPDRDLSPDPIGHQPSGLTIEADPAALTQVVLNLLDNAWKYSRSASDTSVQCSVGPRERSSGFSEVCSLQSVVCSLRSPLPRRAWIAIAITDHGIGIPRRDRRRLFRRFHRGAAALNANVSGVGLGLAMCRHIVRRHGGRIEVASEEGKGSTFTVWLPGGEVRP